MEPVEKLDLKKPYGTVTGHPWARFVQGELLFNSCGEIPDDLPVSDTISDVKEATATLVPDSVKVARTFLENLLKQGALSKSSIYKETEETHQSWENVKEAAQFMGVVTFHKKAIEYWKLSEEV